MYRFDAKEVRRFQQIRVYSRYYFASMPSLEPLASYFRPKTLEDLVGQPHLTGPGGVLRRMVEQDRLVSMIFWGPPGTGKTSTAAIIAASTHATFHRLSGVSSKKEDLIKIVKEAVIRAKEGKQTVIFLDEIHRWTKSQQDTLLPFVEKGIVTLIGATTENPAFTVNNALLSRVTVLTFRQITPEIVAEALSTRETAIREYLGIEDDIIFDTDLFGAIGAAADGDLRRAYALLEATVVSADTKQIGIPALERVAAVRLRSDRDGDEHYDVISGLHKSMRDSDPDAAVYYTMRMLEGGEDPRYLARRMVRFASEDIGNADPSMLPLAVATYQACERLGMPECDVVLVQCAIALARAPKSNEAYRATGNARRDVREYGNLPIPMHLRNAVTSFLADQGYGQGYKYAHDYTDAKVEQQHLPEKLAGRKYTDTDGA